MEMLRPCYGPLFPARAKRAPPSAARASAARASRAKEKGDHNMGAGDVQFLNDALESSIFSSIKCGQRHL